MIVIYIIIAFLLGIIFIQWVTPLIDGIINLILTQFEVWKGHMVVKITNYQKQTSKIKDDFEGKSKTQVIGFTMSDEEEEYYDDDE